MPVWNLFLSWPCYDMSFWGISYDQTYWGSRSNSFSAHWSVDVATEPSLQPISSETFSLASANICTPPMMLTWMLRPEASGVGARLHILMLGYCTPMLPATVPLALLLFIKAMKMQRSKNTAIELGKLSLENLHSIGLYFYWWHGTWGHCILQVFSWSTCHLLGTPIYSQTINWLRCCLSFA